MKREYVVPFRRQAALILDVQRRRNSRFLARRSRVAYAIARCTVSLAVRRRRLRPPTKPLARLKTLFFLFLAAGLLVERGIVDSYPFLIQSAVRQHLFK